MKISEIFADNHRLFVVAEDGREGFFDVSPYLKSEAFEALRDENNFRKVSNGGYFVEWECGADLSVDTIESEWQEREKFAEVSQ